MKLYQHFFFTLCTLLLLGLSSCSSGTTDLSKTHWVGEAQGTYYAVTYYDAQNRNLQTEIDSIFEAFDLVASNWEATSELNAVNDNQAIDLSETFIDLFNKSNEISCLTDGYFDITIGPLAKAYGFLISKRRPVSDLELDSLRQLVSWQAVSINGRRLIKAKPGIRLDFNAIAQGYASDLIGTFLGQQGIDRFLIDVGGEVLARGVKPDGSAWVVGIERPTEEADGVRELQARLSLRDKAIVTSGTYRKYYEEDGIRYSHAIDPKTGKPVTHSLLSVAVVDTFAWRADALATALLVMGLDKSIAFLNEHPGIEAYFIYAEQGTFKTYLTPGLEKMVVQP